MGDGIGAYSLTVADLLRKQVAVRAESTAVEDARGALSYQTLDQRVNRLAHVLVQHGVAMGDRVALLSENRREYLETQLAAAKLGAIVACLNWRLADAEMTHCVRLVSPRVVLVSARHAPMLARIDHRVPQVIDIDARYEELLATAPESDPQIDVDPAQGLVILYTSGTTGVPKGAVISHRAMVARAMCFSAEFGIGADRNFLAWSPLFHMAATDFSLATLMLGGKVVIHDGFDADGLCAVLEREPISWLVAMPGMIEPLIDGLKRNRPRIRSVRMVGAMADLVPLQQIAELTRLIGAPYLNSFGATETGLAPASGVLLAQGVVPESLAKRESGFCRIRLVDAHDRDVPVGVPGELAIRGPTLFSGYWDAPEVNAIDFRGGWFHMGDLFVRQADGSLNFVDRAKYLIKSGGENIYPAEIERVLLAHEAVLEAAVVRRSDAQWGEVPLAFVALKPGAAADAQALMQWCRAQLAGYKVPKDIRFIDAAAFPRSSTGKIQRHEIERQWVAT